ncbi:MAG: hypothetical protein AN484_26430, partial [Aphanizomenon flos-aquae WA102]
AGRINCKYRDDDEQNNSAATREGEESARQTGKQEGSTASTVKGSSTRKLISQVLVFSNCRDIYRGLEAPCKGGSGIHFLSLTDTPSHPDIYTPLALWLGFDPREEIRARVQGRTKFIT